MGDVIAFPVQHASRASKNHRAAVETLASVFGARTADNVVALCTLPAEGETATVDEYLPRAAVFSAFPNIPGTALRSALIALGYTVTRRHSQCIRRVQVDASQGDGYLRWTFAGGEWTRAFARFEEADALEALA